MTRLLEGKHIFIVEDDIVNLSIYSTILSKSGAHIEQDVFGYGMAKGIAMNIVEHLPVDLIILDIMLKRGVSGYDVYDEIRANPKAKQIPVVVVTSLDPETEIPKAREKGINGYISKPVDSIRFADQIASVLQGEKIWVVSR